MNSQNEFSSPDRDSLTRDDLQAIVESTQEHTEDKPERSSLGTNREKKSFKERRENIKNRGGMKIKEYIQTHMRDQLVHFNEYKRIIAHNQSNTEQFTTTLQQRAANALYSRLYSEFYKDDD